MARASGADVENWVGGDPVHNLFWNRKTNRQAPRAGVFVSVCARPITVGATRA
jgi:hypothetical protein